MSNICLSTYPSVYPLIHLSNLSVDQSTDLFFHLSALIVIILEPLIFSLSFLKPEFKNLTFKN